VSTPGYSGTPLAKKMGLKQGQRALLLAVPGDIGEIAGFADFASVAHDLSDTADRTIDYAHLFETDRIALEAMAARLAAVLAPDGMLWLSWPKKASKVPTTVTEDVLREIFLPLGLVDIKVAAVSDIWSGLKFMFRKELRGGL
jgi:hypothetical protein